MNKQWMMGKAEKKRFSLNSGQAIILIAVSMIALLAFIGVAIDGGRLLLLRRDAQNANDAAVLSSVFSLCTGGSESQVIAAGTASAASNGFTNGVSKTTVVVDPDPVGLPADACAECSVGVEITRQIDPYFIQLVYKGDLEVTTYAVGTCDPESVPIENDLVDTDGDGIGDTPAPGIGVLWTGGTSCEANVQVNDGMFAGDIHSNGTIKFQPSNAGGQNCNTPPANYNGGWVFGNITYADPSLGNWPDSKIYECDWADFPGSDVEPPVCGASCLTSSGGGDGSVSNDNDPEKVAAYVDVSGNPIWPAEADYDISDFAPGGPVALELGSKYHVVANANDLWTQYALYGPGVYYTTSSISLKKNDAPNTDVTMTVVSTQQVSFHLEHSFNGYYPQSAPQVYRLAVFANGGGPAGSCVAKDLHVTSTDGIFRGIMFAPYGEAKFSTSSASTQEGCVVGFQTSISSSQASMICDPGSNETRGAISFQQ